MTHPTHDFPGPQVDVETEAERKVRRVELFLSNLLRVGVGTSFAIICFGTIVFFVHHPDFLHAPSDYHQFIERDRAFPHTLGDVCKGIANFRGESYILLGLILLIATPVMRVAVSILAFIYQKDRRFAVITAIVLFFLLLSFYLGHVER